MARTSQADVNASPQRGAPALAKALLDRGAALFGLTAATPLMLGVSAAILLEGEGPIFFSQERPGLHARPFRLYKFRTMRSAVDARGELLPDGARLTRLGTFLRRTSLDELPQLWNVLRGELSLVGPRPLLMEYLERYSPEQARRHLVKPGMTGQAQINGRNAISWEEKFALDCWYVDHWTLALDFKILFQTVGKVIGGRGVSSMGSATMSLFTGSLAQGAEEKRSI